MNFTLEFFNTIMNVLNTILNYFFFFLPASPFTGIVDAIGNIPYLKYINWFIPVGTIVSITSVWLATIAIFYLYQIILRWIKAIDA